MAISREQRTGGGLRDLSLHIPDCFTKELKLQVAPEGERRLRISSNLLQMMGFQPCARYERRVMGPAAGFELRIATGGPVQIYRRSYRHRRNNPTETVIDERCQSFLNACIPSGIERVHLTMRRGVIVGVPAPERTFHIRRAIRDRSYPIEAICALSSGVDAACLGAAGFTPQALLEFRPQEKRDSRDMTETGVMTAIANNAFRFVFNEDIFRADFDRIRETLKGQPRVALLSMSPQCDDFAGCKPNAAKARHVETLDTTIDMFYDCLRLVEIVNPAVVHVEQVPGFLNSAAGQMTILKLRRWGYHVTSGIYDARDFGGHTSRRRCYIVASVFPGFEPPAAMATMSDHGRIWRLIEDQLPFCRDATSTSSLQKGVANMSTGGKGQARLITSTSNYAPTILKSQPRHAKDSIFIAHPDGRYLFPNETILRRLQGIPDSFSLDAVSGEIAAEQIGQSIDWAMHHSFAVAIRKHLAVNRGEVAAGTTADESGAPAAAHDHSSCGCTPRAGAQLDLFRAW